jgi:hypothetical protein
MIIVSAIMAWENLRKVNVKKGREGEKGIYP